MVDLGIQKRLLKKELMKKKKFHSLTEETQKGISEFLEASKKTWPKEFSRKPSLEDIAHWKGTQFRSSLLYLGPVALENAFEDRIEGAEYYNNFLALHIATRKKILMLKVLKNSVQ